MERYIVNCEGSPLPEVKVFGSLAKAKACAKAQLGFPLNRRDFENYGEVRTIVMIEESRDGWKRRNFGSWVVRRDYGTGRKLAAVWELYVASD